MMIHSRRRRLLVEANGGEVWVRWTAFNCLCHPIAPRHREGGPGWIDGEVPGHPASNAIHRMKEDLAEVVDLEAHILKDGYGKHRLEIPPEYFTFVDSVFEKDHSHLLPLFRE